jgi:hypothetical protein
MRLLTRDKARFADTTGSPGPELLDAIPTSRRRPAANRSLGWVWLALRGLGALAVLATGAVHLHEFDGLYSHIPTIGTLSFLNFLGATAIGLGLLAPVERVGRRYGSALVVREVARVSVAGPEPLTLTGRGGRDARGAHAAGPARFGQGRRRAPPTRDIDQLDRRHGSLLRESWKR